MSLITRLADVNAFLLIGLVFLVVVLTVVAVRKSSRSGAMPDPGTDETKRYEVLMEQCNALARRRQRKEQVAQALLAERLTLLEAAALFRMLDQAPPGLYFRQFREAWPGDTDEERHCHEVIDFVHARLALLDSATADDFRDRLCVELRKQLGYGPLRLPSVNLDSASIDG
jgi:hypothetical protein